MPSATASRMDCSATSISVWNSPRLGSTRLNSPLLDPPGSSDDEASVADDSVGGPRGIARCAEVQELHVGIVATGQLRRMRAVVDVRTGLVEYGIGIFDKDDRIGVGERDAGATVLGCRPCDLLGARRIGQRVDLATLGDVPVLAEPAGKVATGDTERQYGGPGEKVIQRLPFDRVDTELAGTPVGGEQDLVMLAGTDESQPVLALAQQLNVGSGISSGSGCVGERICRCGLQAGDQFGTGGEAR